MSKRHDMERYAGADVQVTQYQSLWAEGIGDLTITCESERALSDNPEKREFVVSIDFPIDKLVIIDKHGETITFSND